MSQWVIVMGTPCVGKTTALQTLGATLGVPVEQSVVRFAGQEVQNEHIFAKTRSNLWLASKMLRSVKCFAHDISNPTVRIFDGSPLCALIHAAARAHTLCDKAELLPCLETEHLVNLAHEMFDVITAAGIRVHVVLGILPTNSDQFAALRQRIDQRGGFDADKYDERMLTNLNYVYYIFGKTLKCSNESPLLRVTSHYLAPDAFLELTPETLT